MSYNTDFFMENCKNHNHFISDPKGDYLTGFLIGKEAKERIQSGFFEKNRKNKVPLTLGKVGGGMGFSQKVYLLNQMKENL